MKVKLMLTCLCDAFYGEVGISSVKILEHVGCEVVFPERQTCCGQPPYNAGDWNAARGIADHCIEALRAGEDLPVVTPSSSCAAMLREGYKSLYERHFPEAYELAEFLVHRVGARSWNGVRHMGGRKVAFHRACHGRALGLTDEQELLVTSIEGIEVTPIAQVEQCCGFGGAFSATHGSISAGIGFEKLENVLASGAEEIVSGDMGCLMHLSTLARKRGIQIKTRHYAELLAEAIDS